jgi:hypothetical protein
MIGDQLKLLMLAVLALLGACAIAPPAATRPAAVADCTQAFVDDDARLARAHVHDAQATAVPGYPALRVDRLLASFNDTLANPAQRAAWLARASALDARSRALEHARLPTPIEQAQEDRLQTCRARLNSALLDDGAAWPALLAAARVADDYSNARRAFGLYALSSRGVLRGVKRMQQREMPRLLSADAANALDATSYVLADDTAQIKPAVPAAPWPRDALGIPRIDADQLAGLFRRHAPELSVVTASSDDLPGTVRQPRPPYVDTAHATLYTQLAYTRFGAAVLPQLVYTWWFAARTAAGGIDPLAGQLDGLSWRVTLDDDSEALAYDVVHNCGCYHMFFPGPRLRARARNDEGDEPPWIPFTVPAEWQGRVRLVLASGSHYLRALAPASTAPPAHHYALAPYDELRNLAVGSQRASLFDEQGLVPGSARGERWFLWPMGVIAPGSMRQWGHQATAFVGRRHFDDAHLIERYFERLPSTSTSSAD